jgi:hypothetical protein
VIAQADGKTHRVVVPSLPLRTSPQPKKKIVRFLADLRAFNGDREGRTSKSEAKPPLVAQQLPKPTWTRRA